MEEEEENNKTAVSKMSNFSWIALSNFIIIDCKE